jgi:hypothetical protein
MVIAVFAVDYVVAAASTDVVVAVIRKQLVTCRVREMRPVVGQEIVVKSKLKAEPMSRASAQSELLVP